MSHQRAVDAFMLEFNGWDSAIRQAGADGLEPIGGPREVGFLLEGLNGGERDLHGTITMALALHGNEDGRATLARAIAKDQVASD